MIQHLQTLIDYLFCLFHWNNNTDNRDSFSDYYVPNIEIKDFNALIDGKNFDLPVETKKKPMKKLLKWVKIMTIQLVIY